MALRKSRAAFSLGASLSACFSSWLKYPRASLYFFAANAFSAWMPRASMGFGAFADGGCCAQTVAGTGVRATRTARSAALANR